MTPGCYPTSSQSVANIPGATRPPEANEAGANRFMLPLQSKTQLEEDPGGQHDGSPVAGGYNLVTARNHLVTTAYSTEWSTDSSSVAF